MKKPNKGIVDDFLRQSNYIEDERSEESLEDAQRAWRYAYNNAYDLDIDKLLKMHSLLMRRINPRIAGKFRNCDVFIGNQRKIFINTSLLKEDLNTDVIVNMVQPDPTKHDFEEFCKNIHVRFEDIHPFEDGNGRVGRMLYNIHRLKSGLPIHVIHEGEEQMSYYKWFK